jgi:hypothetical protein
MSPATRDHLLVSQRAHFTEKKTSSVAQAISVGAFSSRSCGLMASVWRLSNAVMNRARSAVRCGVRGKGAGRF